jgi:hypothetical protein
VLLPEAPLLLLPVVPELLPVPLLPLLPVPELPLPDPPLLPFPPLLSELPQPTVASAQAVTTCQSRMLVTFVLLSAFLVRGV